MIALSYAVHAISAANFTLYLDASGLLCSAAATKPVTFALARNGAVAMIFPPDYVYGDGARDVFVLRPDGSRVRLQVPPDALLSRIFHTYIKKGGRRAFQDVYFQSVGAADDGTPLATVVSHFWGGYMGWESAAFRWTGSSWRQIPSHNVMPNVVPGAEAVNTAVAAADTPGRVAFNGTYGQQWHPDFDRREDPNYLLDRAEFMDGDRVVSLGTGVATAMRGTTVVGYRGGKNPFGPSCKMPRKTFAIEWNDGRARTLGAGVAYDVDGQGEVVGDDEVELGVSGRPVLWRGGRKFVLDRENGSAYAIADDGTIVGRAGDAAFVADARRPQTAVQRLDDHLADRGWHVTAAYGIARTGRILAVGTRRGGSPQLLVLDPAPSK